MDIEDLLKSLNDHKVKFVIIGAAAFPVHGYARATLDTDIFIEPTERNSKKCLAALKDFGYDVNQLAEQDILKKKILLRQYLVEIDIHPYVKGVTFEDVWKHKVRDSVLKSRASVQEGKPLWEAWEDAKIFPFMVTQMVSVGEQTGSLSTMLGKIADFYDEEVETAVSALISIMEPILILLLGGLVGSIIVAMYLPMFDIIGRV